MTKHSVRKSWALRLGLLGAIAIAGATAYENAQAQLPLPTTVDDYSIPGTEALSGTVPFQASFICAGCHGGYDDSVAPYELWAPSMMAQSARDPIFFAALAIANQDGAESGDLCLKCHAPGAWLAGRATPADGSAMDSGLDDFDGVTCHFCHRMVDPIADAENPAIDTGILAGLSTPPGSDFHGGQFVIDPNDSRRGPFDLQNFFIHTFEVSPFHQDSQLCGTCHDVSNPVFERQPNGDYTLTANGAPHPDMAYGNVFPLERTYSEWLLSVYGVTAIDSGGRFGGDKPEVSSCQDCHMPDTNASACSPGLGETRPDMPLHHFNGANSWVIRAIDSIYPQFETGLTPQLIDDAEARTIATLQASADLESFVDGGDLIVRVTNQTGHKLPTGYAEGRRMWLEVTFEDAGGNPVFVHGAYDAVTADLDKATTKVYEIKHGLDNYMAAQTGLPAGDSFHFVLNNEVTKDNRIPPRGYDSLAFNAVGADVIGAAYMEQQHWDDTAFPIPSGATQARVRLLHQTTTKEYIEFLRDENVTNTAGQDAYNLWEQFGKSAPVEMGNTLVQIAADPCPVPVEYGLGKLNSLGDYPTLTTTGSASMAAGNLTLEVSGGIPGQLMVAFRGPSTVSLDHFGGRLLVFSQFRDATLLLDSNGEASIPIPITPDMVGTSRAYQVLFRDNSSASGIGMTSAQWITFCE